MYIKHIVKTHCNMYITVLFLYLSITFRYTRRGSERQLVKERARHLFPALHRRFDALAVVLRVFSVQHLEHRERLHRRPVHLEPFSLDRAVQGPNDQLQLAGVVVVPGRDGGRSQRCVAEVCGKRGYTHCVTR